jgi:hypothetical protein
LLTVCCWLWGGRNYQPAHVNVLASTMRRHLGAHRFVCISDEYGFSSDVEVLPMPDAALALGELLTPEGGRFPSCYRRLWMFSDEARCLGERVLLVDIDLVVVRSIQHLVDRDEPFVGWRPIANWGPAQQKRIGGGLYLMTPGAHREVFDDFAGEVSIAAARDAGFRGSDQAWISYKLAARVPVYPMNSGIYSIRDLANGKKPLPTDACLVQFNGDAKPWHSNLSWVRNHWR